MLPSLLPVLIIVSVYTKTSRAESCNGCTTTIIVAKDAAVRRNTKKIQLSFVFYRNMIPDVFLPKSVHHIVESAVQCALMTNHLLRKIQ